MSFFDEISSAAKTKEQIAAEKAKQMDEAQQQELQKAKSLAWSVFQQVKKDLIKASQTEGVDDHGGVQSVSCITVLPDSTREFIQMDVKEWKEHALKEDMFAGIPWPKGHKPPKPYYGREYTMYRQTLSIKNSNLFSEFDTSLKRFTQGEGISFSYCFKKQEPISERTEILEIPFVQSSERIIPGWEFSLALRCKYILQKK